MLGVTKDAEGEAGFEIEGVITTSGAVKALALAVALASGTTWVKGNEIICFFPAASSLSLSFSFFRSLSSRFFSFSLSFTLFSHLSCLDNG